MSEEKRKNAKRTKIKISRISIVDQVCETIKQDIVNGVWKEGEKLPSESELAEIFGVNRLSVRMALQKLITLGLIETRVGEGSFIKRFSLRPFLNEIAVFYEDSEYYRDVRQLRYLLETECTKIAAQTATQQEKEELFRRLNIYFDESDNYSKDLDNPEALDRLVESDFAFHYMTVKMSHNKLFKDVYFMVQQLIRKHIASLISTRMKKRKEKGLPPRLDDHDDIHWKIYHAIVEGDEKSLDMMNQEMLKMVMVKDVDVFY